MNDVDVKKNIERALHDFSTHDFKKSAEHLFGVMGYSSEKRIQGLSSEPEEFIARFDYEAKFRPEKAFFSKWKTVHFLFQLTTDEIKNAFQMGFAFETLCRVDDTIMESYLFIAVELLGKDYSRSMLASITREINRVFLMPVMVLFNYSDAITLSIINRRLNKVDSSKDVLEKVTLIKDINFSKPHRAHIEILFDLSLDALHANYPFTNFVELHRAWQKALDSSELNNRFYKEIAAWYFWAVQNVTYPKSAGKDTEERNSVGVIRLITRLIFIWFIKEKGLVPEQLFDMASINGLLVNQGSNESTYYKAVLQNLFFGTLNTEMGKRQFRHESSTLAGRSDDYLSHNRYRYKGYFKDPEAFLQLCSNVPFLNGGLFECLDKSETQRIDGFSDRPNNELSVPDYLFFSGVKDIDLNDIFGTTNKRYQVRGIIEIFKSYKFTIVENTPIEEEIALDPELLGKVFENLLASYNPETGVTARKKTGSFYTPREIVNYMVDETLLPYLEAQLKARVPILTKMTDLANLLREVFAYTEKAHPFNAVEANALIDAIDNIKIIDPACGSGAFPLGMLHKLIFILGKLDPDNKRWKELQIKRVDELPELDERQNALAIIQQEFASEPNYARKLYLIENCLYGVDIQPIAVQIAKLRCFISLVVDDEIDDSRPNRGIRPLPNLETKFVAANSLVTIERPSQLKFGDSDAIRAKEKKLAEVRRYYFLAQTTRIKNKWRTEDKRLRDEIKEILLHNDFPSEAAQKLAYWDPYEPNTHADFFDPEWMFGLPEGFDVVIGNPPYLRVQGIQQTQPEYMPYYREHYQSAQGNFDLYALFIERGYKLLNTCGQFSFIVPHKFFQAAFGDALRRLLTKHQAVRQIVRFGSAQVFEESTTYTCLLFLSAQPNTEFDLLEVKTLERGQEVLEFARLRLPHPDYAFERRPEPSIEINKQAVEWDFSIGEDNRILTRMQLHPQKLEDLARKMFQGLATSADKLYILEIINESANSVLCYSKHLEEEVELEKGLVKPCLMGKDVHRYEPPKARCIVLFPYIIQNNKAELMPQSYIKRNFPLGWEYLERNKKALGARERDRMHGDGFYAYIYPKNMTEFEAPKIMIPEICCRPEISVDQAGGLYHSTTIYSLALKSEYQDKQKYFLGLLNSKIAWYFVSAKGTPLRGGFTRFMPIYVKPLPIPESTLEQQGSIETLVDYVLYLKALEEPPDMTSSAGLRVMTAYFEQLIDALVYELYFPEEFSNDVRSPLHALLSAELPVLNKLGSNKLSGLRELYQRLYATDHPVRRMAFFLAGIETVRVIEAKSKWQ